MLFEDLYIVIILFIFYCVEPMTEKPFLFSSPNIDDFDHEKLKSILHRRSHECKCGNPKIYKCLEAACSQSDLICPKCDVFNLNGIHFDHQFTYLLPLLKDIRKNNLGLMMNCANKHLAKLLSIQEQLQFCLERVKTMISESEQKVKELDKILETKKYPLLEANTKKLKDLKDIDQLFKGVGFLTISECKNFMSDLLNNEKNHFIPYIPSKNNQSKNELLTKIGNFVSQQIKSATQKQISYFTPFIELNKQIIKFSEINSVDEHLYTNNFEFSRVQYILPEKISLCQLFDNLYRLRFCKQLSIISENRNFLEEDWDKDKTEALKFLNLKVLKVSGRENLINGMMRIIKPEDSLENFTFTVEDISENNRIASNVGSNVVAVNGLIEIQRKESTYYFPLLQEIFSLPKIVGIKLTYAYNTKTSFWSENKLNRFKELLICKKDQLQEICLNTVKWHDPEILNLLNQCKYLISFSLAFALPRASTIPQTLLTWKEMKLHEKCRQKRKALYSLAKQRKCRVFGQRTNKFDKFYHTFIMESQIQ